MLADKDTITLFEHQSLRLDQVINKIAFTENKLKALQRYYGTSGVPYFSLIHNGIRFNQYVGVIQVGGLVIEVLPKADSDNTKNSKNKWRNILIGMLKASGVLKVSATSSANLKIKTNSILDLYFELFINEIEYLLHSGLIKRYRKIENNVTSLKGNLQFSKHIQQNLVHQERFYVRHVIYDNEHLLHSIIYKTLRLLKRINTDFRLHSRIGSLLLNFPEMKDIRINPEIFKKLIFNRKSQSYKEAIEIAKLILLQYHPDLKNGSNHVLALMFDMNKLWEKFIYKSLHNYKDLTTKVIAQKSKQFWKRENRSIVNIKPDIIINEGQNNCIVLDTKWKNLDGYNPSVDDLRQLYAYLEYYNAKSVALVYPGTISGEFTGHYMPTPSYDKSDKECRVISIAVPDEEKCNIKRWQAEIKCQIGMILSKFSTADWAVSSFRC